MAKIKHEILKHGERIVDGIVVKYLCGPCPVCAAKLEAAEEMANLWPKVREFVGFKNSLPSVREDVIAFDTALAAWEKAGKGEE